MSEYAPSESRARYQRRRAEGMSSACAKFQHRDCQGRVFERWGTGFTSCTCQCGCVKRLIERLAHYAAQAESRRRRGWTPHQHSRYQHDRPEVL